MQHRKTASLLGIATLLSGGLAAAFHERPQVSPAAAALLAKGPVFLVPDDNLAVPLGVLEAAEREKPKVLKLSTATAARAVPYHRQGRWELEHPYITPDGAWVLAAIRDYTQSLDEYSFVVVDTKTLEYKETSLSANFVPGPQRIPL